MRVFLFYFFILFHTSNIYSQCFDCAKNIGGWTDESAIDIEKTIDGMVYLVDSNGFVASTINKYDFNCNLIWSKSFGYVNVNVKAVTSDEQGNIYLVIHNTSSTNGGLGPWIINGFSMSPGLNFYKLNSAGTILWSRHIGPRTAYEMQDIHYFQNQLFITGTFYDNLTFSNGLTFNFPYSDYPRAFIAKYDTNGNFIDAVNQGTGNDIFKYSEIDNQGNIYLTRSHYNRLNSIIDKFNSSLQLNWSKILSSSTNSSISGIYTPTGIRFNSENNKLYIWGKMNLTTTILGNTYFINNSNGIFQSALTELNTATGNLENIKRFDNNSSYSNAFTIAVGYGRSAHMAEKNGYLYILTSFKNSMSFPNGTITSTTYNNGNYFSEELVLFKMKLSDFTSELVFKSYGVPNLSTNVTDLPGPILFNGDDLYLTATFGSTPMQINGATINNNSGNHNPDAMYYKFNINSSSNTGTINVQNTCYNEFTEFSLDGNYDSILWDFGDPNSSNNSSTLTTPQHQFTSSGNFHITATITCGSSTQIIEKDIVINNRPQLNNLNPINMCETISGSGISSMFNTTNLNSLLIGSQQNVILEYRDSNGNLIANALPNPYTNTNNGGDTITVKAYYVGNPYCFSQTTIQFLTLPKPVSPTLTAQQIFCNQNNATLNNITITGQNIKWYNALTGGNVVANTTVLQNGSSYYASQTINGCESTRVPVTVTIQNTPAPTGNAAQSFCSSQNATINDITASGSNVIWYSSLTGNSALPITTLLSNNTAYYATQTVNGCESPTRLMVTVTLINTLNANDYAETFCDDLNDGSETMNLSDYNTSLISSTANHTFTYYTSRNSAENQTHADEITNYSNYNLTTGTHRIYVRIDSPNGCHQVVELKLTVVSKPIIPIKDIMPICEGASISVDAGNGFDSYSWSTTETTPSIIISTPGNYSVTVTQNHGTLICTSVKNFTVVNSNMATVSEIVTSDWTDNQNTITVLLTGNSVGNYSYSLDGTHYQASNTFTGLESGEYTVFIKDENGCGIKPEDFYLLMYPKFFTPNGDGYNDSWKIKFSEKEPNLTVKIFDRYGKLVKQLGSNSEGWNGTYNNQLLPATDYWFVITRQNGKEYRGHFTLKR